MRLFLDFLFTLAWVSFFFFKKLNFLFFDRSQLHKGSSKGDAAYFTGRGFIRKKKMDYIISNSSTDSPKIKFSRSRQLASISVSPAYESFEVKLNYIFFFFLRKHFNGRYIACICLIEL